MTELSLDQVSSINVEGSRGAYYAVKRILDLVLASVLLVVLAPFMVLIAILIKLETPGPAIFAQERVGARRRAHPNGATWEVRIFRAYKFRSMVQHATALPHQAHVKAFVEGRLLPSGESGARYKLQKDPRITRIGRFIRTTSIDELPQLFNVLTGTMSLVGPRPVPPYEILHYKGEHHERFAAIPGITGLWQVKGRSDLSYEEMCQLDREYVRRQSLSLDMKIMLMTIPAILSTRGAQ